MSLSKKYDVPTSTIKKMIADGVISCSWPSYEEVYKQYQETKLLTGKCKTQVVYEIANKTQYSERRIFEIIAKFEH